MSESPAQLRRRIGSAVDLQSVVRAMRAQAAASVGQYVNSVAALADYARTVELGLGACFRQHPFASAARAGAPAGKSRPVHAVVFGSDQGLVGRFNETVVEFAGLDTPAPSASSRVWAVGERMRGTLADGGTAAEGSFAVPATVQGINRLVADILLSVVDPMAKAAAPGPTPELLLFYNRPTTGSAYVPVRQQLLPLDDAWRRELALRPWPTPLPAQVIGEPIETLRALIGEYLFVSLFRASAESLASENASRLAAMDRADRNIDKMLLALHDRFHRLRQSKIDEELADVISGFKALSRQAANGCG